MTLADKLKEARKNAGLTQAELAEKICVSRQAITKWETDKGIPDIDNLRVLSKVLNVSIDFLLDEEETLDQTVIKEQVCLDDSVKEEELESKNMLPILKIVFIVLLVLCALLLSVFLLLWTAKRTRPAQADAGVKQELESEPPVEEPATPDKIESTEPPVAEDVELADTPEPESTEVPVTTQEPETTEEPSYASMVFIEVNEPVTAKDATNLRDSPSQGEDSVVLVTLQNGETATRIGISETGWSKLEYNGEICYAVSSLLTTDLTAKPQEVPEDDGIKTVFTECNERVSPKIEVNLRTLPSVTNPDSQVVATIRYGEIVTRTGINTDVGWSRVEYGGETLYCISSYVYVVE